MIKTKFFRSKKAREARIFKGFERFDILCEYLYLRIFYFLPFPNENFANMRKYWVLAGFCTALFFIGLSSTSCSRKVGCPANEAAHVKPNRKGELPTSGGYTRLFPKDFNKKPKKKRKN